MKNKQGKSIYVEVVGTVIEIGKKKMDLVLLRDITYRKQVELELKEKIKELEELNSLMVGREIKMVELKKEVERLRTKCARRKQ